MPESANSPIPTIEDAGSLKGKAVLLRTSLNVPIEEGEVRNDFRIRRALPTIERLVESGAILYIVAHIGRAPEESLYPVFLSLKAHLPQLQFARSLSEARAMHAAARAGDVVLVENLRQSAGEVMNDPEFAKALSELGEVYINDAFAASHRSHASIVGVPQHLPHFAGDNFLDEMRSLDRAKEPKHPSLMILGGAKFETKRPMIVECLGAYEKLFVGGALANDFFKAKGYEVGTSLISENIEGVAELLNDEHILLPLDVMAQNKEGESRVCAPSEVESDESILDCGPETVALLKEQIENAAFVLWNGPLGNYEKGYATHTEEVARALAASSAHSVVGGGDTVASIAKLNLVEEFTFVSTGGGAMLEYLAEGTTVGIDALQS